MSGKPRLRTEAPGEAIRPEGVSRCPHCGAAVEGAEDVFCCAGCEMADAIIRGAGLERYYVERASFAPRPEPLPGGPFRSWQPVAWW